MELTIVKYLKYSLGQQINQRLEVLTTIIINQTQIPLCFKQCLFQYVFFCCQPYLKYPYHYKLDFILYMYYLWEIGLY